jgi:hypothetical protein
MTLHPSDPTVSECELNSQPSAKGRWGTRRGRGGIWFVNDSTVVFS